MLSTTQWTALLTSEMHWKQRYPEIAHVVREVLPASTEWVDEISTTQLVEDLMPLTHCRGTAITARNLLFKVLMKLSKNELRDCARIGEEKRGKFGKIHPIFWHAPIAQKCPHCGGVL